MLLIFSPIRVPPGSRTVTTREWLNYLDKTDTVAVRKGEQASLESCDGPFISERLKKFFEKN